MRRNARESVYKILYSLCFNEDITSTFIENIYNEDKLTAQDREFANELYQTITNNNESISKIIEKYAVGYSFDRLFATDVVALKIGIAEITYFESVPDIVAIDEACWLARKFSSEKSINYVNGLLAKIKNDKDNNAICQ